ncbi:hypothetical protein RclHR1_10440003 [Rhizophagus clarus]|uniref:hAT-like transposase RNase-H fold domain-containing protein n=1 Tax=Rhizophagus clarus TaxID=94130 RepID=A0A2Z6Q1L0_9GLOM|nr:hypothetical protein RclHR1_10440003 [Rhizophagus clarus]
MMRGKMKNIETVQNLMKLQDVALQFTSTDSSSQHNKNSPKRIKSLKEKAPSYIDVKNKPLKENQGLGPNFWDLIGTVPNQSLLFNHVDQSRFNKFLFSFPIKISDNDFDDVNCDEYEYESFLDNEYNQDAPDAPQDPVISEENDNSEKENLSQSCRISPAWNYFNDRTSQYPGRPVCCRCQKVFGKDTEKEKSERDNAVVEWIIGDVQPFRTVENLQFRQMVNTFDSRYQVPDKNGIKNLVIDYFEAKRDNIQYDLNNIPGKISLTTDIWTSTFNNDAYLGLTIHFIDNDWNLQNFLLNIMSFTTRHTGGNIADAIISTLKEFHIFEKTLALTSDNESAMVVCRRIIAAKLAYELDNQSFHHYRCSAHILNLAAQQGIKIIDNEIDTLILLEPLEKATVLLSVSSYPTISDIRFLFLEIQQHLDDYVRKEEFSQSRVASSILEKIKKYWEVVDSFTTVATILDPRTKLTLYATGEESTNVVNAIKSHFTEYNVSPPPAMLSNTNQKTISNWEYFHQLKRRRLDVLGSQTERSERRSRSTGIHKELDWYLALPYDDNVEPLLWWKAHF